jgi:hypothetical protein
MPPIDTTATFHATDITAAPLHLACGVSNSSIASSTSTAAEPSCTAVAGRSGTAAQRPK